jgi:hypothetical protein
LINFSILFNKEGRGDGAENMTWKGIKPIVKLVDKIYQTGIVPTTEESPLWDVTILPTG